MLNVNVAMFNISIIYEFMATHVKCYSAYDRKKELQGRLLGQNELQGSLLSQNDLRGRLLGHNKLHCT